MAIDTKNWFYLKGLNHKFCLMLWVFWLREFQIRGFLIFKEYKCKLPQTWYQRWQNLSLLSLNYEHYYSKDQGWECRWSRWHLSTLGNICASLGSYAQRLPRSSSRRWNQPCPLCSRPSPPSLRHSDALTSFFTPMAAITSLNSLTVLSERLSTVSQHFHSLLIPVPSDTLGSGHTVSHSNPEHFWESRGTQ